MRNPTRRATALVGALILVSTASACTTLVPGSSTSASPVPAAPDVGTCLALAGSDIDDMTGYIPRVPCADPAYSAQVFATADLPTLGDSLSAYGRPDVEQAIGTACDESALDTFLGADPVETPFVQTTFFTATERQWTLGARWAYCVVAYSAETVRPAPGLLQDAFSRSPAADYRTCLRLEGFLRVACSRPHDAEYTGVVLQFGPNPLNPLQDPALLPGALSRCLAAFDAYVPQPPDPRLDYSVTEPPPEDYDPTVGVAVTCAVYYQDMMPRSTSVRD